MSTILHIIQAVIRPVLEYVCPAWHYSLTKGQTKAHEDVQRHALQIINNKISYTKKSAVRSIRHPYVWTSVKHYLHRLLETRRKCFTICCPPPQA